MVSEQMVRAQGQGEDNMAVQLNEEEQLLVITRLHQVLHGHIYVISTVTLHREVPEPGTTAPAITSAVGRLEQQGVA